MRELLEEEHARRSADQGGTVSASGGLSLASRVAHALGKTSNRPQAHNRTPEADKLEAEQAQDAEEKDRRRNRLGSTNSITRT